MYAIIIGGRVYIGSSSQVKKRIKFHLWQLKSGRHSNSILQRSYNKFGTLIFTVVEECGEADRFEREQKWMDYFFGLGISMNESKSARISIKQFMNDKTKAKISAAHKGKEIPKDMRRRISESLVKYYATEAGRAMRITISERMTGRERKAESNEAVASKLRGRKRPESVVRKISESNKGKTHSSETKEKIRASLKGRDYGDQWRAKVVAAGKRRAGLPPAKTTIDAARKANTKIKITAILEDGNLFTGSIPEIASKGLPSINLRIIVLRMFTGRTKRVRAKNKLLGGSSFCPHYDRVQSWRRLS